MNTCIACKESDKVLKHSLANIFLTYIMKDLLKTNRTFKDNFKHNIILWKRFIDDGGGATRGGIVGFMNWLGTLREHFKKYELELTADTDAFTIKEDTYAEKEIKSTTFLDMDMFKHDNSIHTKEHRKETSATSYLNYTSAHPRYTFKGIMKSQLQRIRRLCSREDDYLAAGKELKERCIASGYKLDVIDAVFANYEEMPRNLQDRHVGDDDDTHKVRLIALSGTRYEKEIGSFATRMNRVLATAGIRVEIVKTTGPSLSKSLFHNNNNGNDHSEDCGNCIICNNGARNLDGEVSSTVTGKSYKITKNLTCANGGIYVINGVCKDQYTGKTTVPYGTRTNEHIRRQKSSSVFKHREKCVQCSSGEASFSISLIEDYRKRGKYSLSEREYLWNYRIKGVINDQKTLLN